MMVNSRRKGKRGELELSRVLSDVIADANTDAQRLRRGQQYSGIGGADVIGVNGIHFEVKRVNRLNVYVAMEQSIQDAGEVAVPTVHWRADQKQWLSIFPTALTLRYLRAMNAHIWPMMDYGDEESGCE